MIFFKGNTLRISCLYCIYYYPPFFHKPLSSFFFILKPWILTNKQKGSANGGKTADPTTNVNIEPTATDIYTNFISTSTW